MADTFLTDLESKLYAELMAAGRVITMVVDTEDDQFVTTVETPDGVILATGRSMTPLNSLARALDAEALTWENPREAK